MLDRSIRLLLACAMMFSWTACSTLSNPYVDPGHPRPGLLREQTKKAPPILDEEGLQPRHVTVAQAREYARLLQDAYRKAAGNQSRAQSTTETLLVGAAATALGIAATGGDAETAGLIGVSGAGVGFLGNRRWRPIQRRIYFQGALALECVVAAATANVAPDVRSAALKRSLLTLNHSIRRVGSARVSYERAVDSRICRGDASETVRNAARQALIDTDLVAAQAQATADAIRSLMDEINPLGQLLLSKVEEIRLRVDAEIAKAEPDLLTYNDALRGIFAGSPGGIATDEAAKALFGDDSPGSKSQERARSDVDRVVRSMATATDCEKELQVHGETLRQAVTDLTAEERSIIKSLKGKFGDPVRYPPGLFDNCALANPIGIGPLQLAKDVLEVAKGTAVMAQIGITGGRAPYSVATGTYPGGVTPKVTGQTSMSATLEILLSADATKNLNGSFAVAVQDSAGAARNLIIKASADDTKKQTVPVDVKLQNIQIWLKAQGYTLGNKGADGIWGPDTQDAIAEHLKKDFQKLKSATNANGDPRFPEFAQQSSAPNFLAKSKQELMKYMEFFVNP